MKLQTAKAGLWLVTLAMSGTTVATAQISPAQAFSATRGYSGNRDVRSVHSAGKPSELESPLVATEPSLPDAPSAVAERQSPDEAPPSAPSPVSPPSPRSATDRSLSPAFLIANGMLLGSTIANAEAIARCRPTSCQSVPDAIRQRGTLYAIGIPASLGISYISYRLKRSGTKWWIAPVALFTAGNIIYAANASRWSTPKQ